MQYHTGPEMLQSILTNMRMKNLEKMLEPNCGKCKFYRNSGCPKSTLCKTRLVRTYPLPDAESCDRYRPNYDLQDAYNEYIHLKLQRNY
jgi:hypothetical protein